MSGSMFTNIYNLVALFTALLDLCLSRECYLPRQKQLLLSWKQKLYSIWGPLPSPHQNVSPKEKAFNLKSPHISPCSYGPHAGLQPGWAGWNQQHNAEDNKERLTVPSPGDTFHQRKDHPFLMPRNSAPNIGSSLMFSSPLSYKKRYSFQDGVSCTKEVKLNKIKFFVLLGSESPSEFTPPQLPTNIRAKSSSHSNAK